MHPLTSQAADIDIARVALEAAASRLCKAILGCAPMALLTFLWEQVIAYGDMAVRDTGLENVEEIDIAMAMEYQHAVLSNFRQDTWGTDRSTDAMHAVLRNMVEVRSASIHYCKVVNADHRDGEFSRHSGELHVRALSSWIFGRAYRYGVLESEFLQFAFEPHNDALKQAYGIDATGIAEGLQAALSALMQTKKVGAPERNNVSNTSGLPEALLDDLSYRPGETTEFFDPGFLSGTPLRTLPGRLKPLVRLDDGHYACDPYFLRDTVYRAVQRGLRRRIPGYESRWTRQQTKATETAFTRILGKQLAGATTYSSVFYRDVRSGEWCELDLLVSLDDALFVVEVKGGVMPTHSPELDFGKYSKKVEQLIKEAYGQARRFLEYASSRPEVTLFARDEKNKMRSVGKLRLSHYRLVFPIGLTIESFIPFSSASKQLPGVDPVLGRYPFIAMAIDDLFILTRFLPTAGELMHYLTVRQRLAASKELILNDEADHLGLYVSHKRYDIAADFFISRGAERIVHEKASAPIDAHFNQPDWNDAAPPRQRFTKRFEQILCALDGSRTRGFLRTDAMIRDLGDAARARLETDMEAALPRLSVVPYHHILFEGAYPCLLCLQREDYVDVLGEHLRAAQEAARVSASARCPVLIVLVDQGMIRNAWGAIAS